ncbi:ABC transporter permease [Cellulomonas sp. APG4]|uniref:ABC transporter permease n=1 Tax=Cellulomonas sp. APG4 TaxID=1538656 RepID=UPI00137973D1|nr:ABC transporter permease [Cellulomonas sp. APG4]NCT91009.1 ABC transporter permease [Cellulomonas sp. APG4]
MTAGPGAPAAARDSAPSLPDDVVRAPAPTSPTRPSARRRRRPEQVPLDGVTRVGRAFAIGAAVLTLVPIPLVLLVALSASWREGPFAGLTTQWLVEAWTRVQGNLGVSVRVAVLVLVLDLLIGFPAAWLIARHRFPGRRLLQAVSTVPIAVPGIAIGLGLILAYPTLRPSGVLMVAGHVLYTLPFLLGALTPALGDPAVRVQESVAATLGAGPVRRLLTVTLPGVRGALLAATLMVLTLSFGEFNVAFFLFTPTQQPLPVVLYDGYLTGRLEAAAAATVLFLACVVPAALALERLGGAKVGQA